MGALIDGEKVFEDEELVVYSFESTSGRSGRVAASKSDLSMFLVVPDPTSERAAMAILHKASRQASSSGTWPAKVVYAA